MLHTIKGLILRTVKYAESSVICDIFSRELGLRTYILNGVRQQNSKIGAALVRPMNWVELVVYHREDREINRVKEIRPFYIYQKIPFDVIKGSIALFITEIVQKSIKESVENQELYEFLQNSYQLLDRMESRPANFHLAFLVKLTRYLGFMPEGENFYGLEDEIFFDYQNGEFCKEKPMHIYFFDAAQSQLMLNFLEKPISESSEFQLNSQKRIEMIESLLKFYQYHIENLNINAHAVLHQVMG
jgi:DNA repair protein RecO (recombination protein O)